MNNSDRDTILMEIHEKIGDMHGTMKAHVANANIHQTPPCRHMRRVEKGVLAMLCGMAYMLLQRLGIV